MKKKLYILGLAFLIVTFITVKSTYALFETNASGDTNFEIGKWIIKLNDKNISFDKLITLDDFVFINSVHTEDGYFAPGSRAEFELDMDVSESDVSVEYEIEIDDTVLEPYPNIHFKIYDVDTDSEMVSNSASGVIRLEDANKVKKIKIVLVWEDLEEYDESDTSLIGEELTFKAKVNFKQYIEE